MKIELKPRDWILLKVACSALIIVLMFRFGILPAIDAYEEGQIKLEERSSQAEEMQSLIDSRPANERRISDGMARLDELSDSCYELMENRQVDELVTGVALSHKLFPSHLSISEQTAGIKEAYLYSEDGAAAAEGEEAEATAEDLQEEFLNGEAATEGWSNETVSWVNASISLNGSESDMKAFLNDIEEHYPAVHVKSFEMMENMYLDKKLETMTETQMNVVLEVYMYSRPEEQ